MCDLAASIRKEKGLNANFGMGAKVASLPLNKHGIVYRSCKSVKCMKSYFVSVTAATADSDGN